MMRLLVEIDKSKTQFVIKKLQKYGQVYEVSKLMNIFSVEDKVIPVKKIENINGVISVQEDVIGKLMPFLQI